MQKKLGWAVSAHGFSKPGFRQQPCDGLVRAGRSTSKVVCSHEITKWCLLSAGSFNFSPQSGELYELLESPHGLLLDFLQRKWPKRPRWNLPCILWPSLKVIYHPSYSILWVTQPNLDSIWKETTPFCQEVKIIGGHFGGRYCKHLVHRLFAKIYVYPLRTELRPTAKKTLR